MIKDYFKNKFLKKDNKKLFDSNHDFKTMDF